MERILLLLVGLLGLTLNIHSPARAFDDDSTDDTRSLLEIRTICEDGRNVIDTRIHKSSCSNDDAYINRRRTGIFKNGVEITHEKILDFKISRNGRVYYRTEIGPYLYGESGRLNSSGAPVLFYLVSTSGDVVYMNDHRELYKNGVKLNRGPARIPLKKTKTEFLNRRLTIFLNPAVTRSGEPVYVNEIGQLFVAGRRINPQVTQARTFKINSTGDVYYLDDAGKLYRNEKRLFKGSSRILEFRLNNNGQVAYLTDLPTKNLFLEDRPLSAGAHRIINFSFNTEGEIFYQDDIGRLWKNGIRLDD